MTAREFLMIGLFLLPQLSNAQQRIPNYWINTFYLEKESLPTPASGAIIELLNDRLIFVRDTSRYALPRSGNTIAINDTLTAKVVKQTSDSLIIAFPKQDLVFEPLITFDGEFDETRLYQLLNSNSWFMSDGERLDYWYASGDLIAICGSDTLTFWLLSHYGYRAPQPVCLRILRTSTKRAVTLRAFNMTDGFRARQLFKQTGDTLFFQEANLEGVVLGKLWPSSSNVSSDSKTYHKLVDSGWRRAKSKPEAKNDSTINLRMPRQKRWIFKKTRIFFAENSFKINLNYLEQVTGRWSLHDDLFILLHDDRGLIGFASIINNNKPVDALQVRLFQPFDTESILFIPWKNK